MSFIYEIHSVSALCGVYVGGLECFFFMYYFLLTNGVFGVDGDEVKSVTVGDSVTLHTDITQIQTDQQILWMFGPKETRIAEIIKRANLSFIDDNDGRFKGTLKLDSQTGSLTITNITITNSGLYKLTIISNKGTSYKRYNVTVYAHLPVPVISSNSSSCSSSLSSSNSKCVLLCSVLNVRDVSLSWYKGNSLLSSISVSDLNIRLSLPLEVEYQDTNTYSCVVSNPITNQTQHLNINDICQMCSELQYFILVIAAVVVLLVALVVGVIYCYYKKFKQPVKEAQTPETEIVYTQPFSTQRLQHTDFVEADRTEYSCVVTRHK
ncbi:SLAM family member 5-like isoform X2 [Paramisgurnus dabryanus]|uniref:SLAM family member 5-like isoform X2 n=1 Tax=Paramisgurnus dabryanus TaxID=90735 RepID=UPI0031F37D34